MMTFALLYINIAISFLICLLVWIKDVIKWYSLPQGPLPLPFIGNATQLSKSLPWIRFTQWAEKYGGIYSIWLGRRPTLIISDPVICSTLLDKRGNKYSSRPYMVMVEIYNKMAVILVLPFGKRWTRQRKLIHHALKSSTLPAYKPRQSAEATRLVVDILERQESWASGLERFAASVIISMAYGRRVEALDSKIVKSKIESIKFGSRLATPGEYWAETIPLLAKLPNFLAPWKKYVEARGLKERYFNNSLVNVVKEDLKKGYRQGSLAEMILELRDQGNVEIDDIDLANVPGTMFAAGGESTSMAIKNVLLGLITHPEVFAAAQGEIDSIVGSTRSPTFEDQLPYIDAMVKESLRWRNSIPLGIPHATTENDKYENFHIPKGTIVIANNYAMNLDPTYFPSPQIFAPSRFLHPTHPLSSTKFKGAPFPHNAGHAGFGWGRRTCPGSGLAMNSIRIVVSKLIWAFHILPEEGETYGEMDVETGGLIQRAREFGCRFEVRSEEHADVLRRELVEAERVFQGFLSFD